MHVAEKTYSAQGSAVDLVALIGGTGNPSKHILATQTQQSIRERHEAYGRVPSTFTQIRRQMTREGTLRVGFAFLG